MLGYWKTNIDSLTKALVAQEHLDLCWALQIVSVVPMLNLFLKFQYSKHQVFSNDNLELSSQM